MKDYIKIDEYPKVSFKGKTIKEISLLINKLKDFLSKMKQIIEFMKKGQFENLELDEIKDNLKKFNNDLNSRFYANN